MRCEAEDLSEMGVGPRVRYELGTPLLRIQELSVNEKLLSVMGGTLVFFWTHIFAFPFLMMIVLGGVDWKVGMWIAENKVLPNGETAYSEIRARLGLVAKVLGIFLTLAIFAFELWVYDSLSKDVDLGAFARGRGWAGTAIAIGFVVMEMKSLNRKRRDSGGPEIPVLDKVFGWLDWISGSMAPKKGPEIVKDDEDKVA